MVLMMMITINNEEFDDLSDNTGEGDGPGGNGRKYQAF
jgi:hypothetical protein